MHLLKLTASSLLLLGLVAAAPQYHDEDDTEAANGASATGVSGDNNFMPNKEPGNSQTGGNSPAGGNSQVAGNNPAGENTQTNERGNTKMPDAKSGENNNEKGKDFMEGPPEGFNNFKGFGSGHPHGRFGL